MRTSHEQPPVFFPELVDLHRTQASWGAGNKGRIHANTENLNFAKKLATGASRRYLLVMKCTSATAWVSSNVFGHGAKPDGGGFLSQAGEPRESLNSSTTNSWNFSMSGAHQRHSSSE
jgi:hypothetical protein